MRNFFIFLTMMISTHLAFADDIIVKTKTDVKDEPISIESQEVQSSEFNTIINNVNENSQTIQAKVSGRAPSEDKKSKRKIYITGDDGPFTKHFKKSTEEE